MSRTKTCRICGETKPIVDFYKMVREDPDLLEAAARYLREGVTRGVTGEGE